MDQRGEMEGDFPGSKSTSKCRMGEIGAKMLWSAMHRRMPSTFKRRLCRTAVRQAVIYGVEK